MRLFIAINFSTDTHSRLLALRDELRSRSERGNFTLPENLHLTLVFHGEFDSKQATAIKTVMDTVALKQFDSMIEHIGRFKRTGGNIWWTGLQESKALIDLQHELTDKLIAEGFVLDKRKYSPHITLGREVVTNATPWPVEPFGETVCTIDLMKSERVAGKLTYTSIYRCGKDNSYSFAGERHKRMIAKQARPRPGTDGMFPVTIKDLRGGTSVRQNRTKP